MWADCDFAKGEIVVRGDPETGTKNWTIRIVPMISQIRNFLNELKTSRNPADLPESATRVRECHKAMDLVAKVVGMTNTSSSKSVPPSRNSAMNPLFYRRPPHLFPPLDHRLVPLGGSPGRSLVAPAQGSEESARHGPGGNCGRFGVLSGRRPARWFRARRRILGFRALS